MTMKELVATVRSHAKTIQEGEARLAQIKAQKPKFAAARDAAFTSVEVLQAKANRAAALAAIGEASQADADAALAVLGDAQAKLTKITATLAGLDATEATATSAIAAARTARGQATRAALDAHYDEIARSYAAAAVALVDATRRVNAYQRIRYSLDPGYEVFRHPSDARMFTIPALTHASCAAFQAGAWRESIYSAASDSDAQSKATDAEIATLAAAGIEV